MFHSLVDRVARVSVPTTEWAPFVDAVAEASPGSPVDVAGPLRRLLPADVHDTLVRFADRAPAAGATVIGGVPLGDLPATPPSPAAAGPTPLATFALLAAARSLGQPVGYAPEHGGEVVQQIVPTPESVSAQVSTSSGVELMFHTETAFHPHRPRYLLLLCLRGQHGAATTLASVHALLPHLPEAAVGLLREPRFRTSVDQSFLAGRRNRPGPPHPLLSGSDDEPTFVFDADLTRGVDADAQRVVEQLVALVERVHVAVELDAGDLLVVDNHLVVHGRTPFAARFDGTDRWLQRSFVVSDLGPSAGERDGRVITTVFGDAAPARLTG